MAGAASKSGATDMTDKAEQEKQEDYKAYLENEKLLRKSAEDKRASTYLAHALVDAEAIGGRFAAVGKASVTGSGPIPHPHLPAPSWAGQDTMVEPPLGYAINDQIPVGDQWEIEAAQRILDQRSAAPPLMAVRMMFRQLLPWWLRLSSLHRLLHRRTLLG
jgi:hypothetical protein